MSDKQADELEDASRVGDKRKAPPHDNHTFSKRPCQNAVSTMSSSTGEDSPSQNGQMVDSARTTAIATYIPQLTRPPNSPPLPPLLSPDVIPPPQQYVSKKRRVPRHTNKHAETTTEALIDRSDRFFQSDREPQLPRSPSRSSMVVGLGADSSGERDEGDERSAIAVTSQNTSIPPNKPRKPPRDLTLLLAHAPHPPGQTCPPPSSNPVWETIRRGKVRIFCDPATSPWTLLLARQRAREEERVREEERAREEQRVREEEVVRMNGGAGVSSGEHVGR